MASHNNIISIDEAKYQVLTAICCATPSFGLWCRLLLQLVCFPQSTRGFASTASLPLSAIVPIGFLARLVNCKRDLDIPVNDDSDLAWVTKPLAFRSFESSADKSIIHLQHPRWNTVSNRRELELLDHIIILHASFAFSYSWGAGDT